MSAMQDELRLVAVEYVSAIFGIVMVNRMAIPLSSVDCPTIPCNTAQKDGDTTRCCSTKYNERKSKLILGARITS